MYTVLKPVCDVFSDKPGCTELAKHYIKLAEEQKLLLKCLIVWILRNWKIKEIGEFLKLGIIEQSNSEWDAPIVIGKKQENSERVCTDFRKLNALSCTDSFPMPRVGDLIDKVSRCTFDVS